MSRVLNLTLALLATAALHACGGGGGSPAGGPLADPASTPVPPPVSNPAPDPTPDPVPPPMPDPTPSPRPTPVPAVTPVGHALGPVAVQASLGPAGGQLEAPDYSLTVIVPPGALTHEQTLTLQPIENTAPGARGKAWRLGPPDLVLQQPLQLQWRTTQAERQGANHLRLARQGADGIWRSAAQPAAARSTRASTQARAYAQAASAPAAEADTDGIEYATSPGAGDWSLVAGAQLHPGKSQVMVGQTQALTVVVCSQGNDPAKPGERVHYTCDSTTSAMLNTGWSVNGIPDGNAGVGTLSGPALDPTSRTYQAPAAVPAQNPVAVSVQYADFFDPQARTETLVAEVTVVNPQAPCTWVRDVPGLDIALEQDWRWDGEDTFMKAKFSHTARVSGRLVRDPDPIHNLQRFYGEFTAGRIELAHNYSRLLTENTIEVRGQGAPTKDNLIFAAVAYVDLETCRLTFAASPWVQATHSHTSSEIGGTVTERQPAGLDFGVYELPIGGLRVWGDEVLVPVNREQVQDHVRAGVAGAHHDFGFELGSARVRWTLTPR